MPLRANPNGIEDLLNNLQFGKIGDLARILIFHKISSNLSNIFYAMQASRTDFHAYQFKSVYKFIESFNNRILIADEVGLGKTIEAGLIWLEAKARSDARRLLVVCPSMLREKWKKELRFRFDTKAEIYDAKGLRALLEDFRREGQNFQCAAVCSLNSIRQDSVKTILAEFENTPYKFDLVIVDEAHHLRNTNTKSHAVGKILSEITEAMVLLTATPIHLGSQDLYRLLNLLDENEFSELWQFEQLITENEPIVQAQNLLRYHPPKIEEAREQIEILNNFPSFRNNSNLQQLLTKLETISPQNHGEIVEAGLLLEKLNLLSSHISRTRKREVTEWRVVRESNSLTVRFNKREADFYRAVTESVQNRVENFSGNKITAFALMMPQRQMASCIPAMVEHYRKNSLAIDEEILEELGFDTEESQISEATNLWLELEQLVAEWDEETPDSKFDVLLDALRVRFEREPNTKIIVFSYFKKTLAYLNRRLGKEGFAPV
ncbi:MAG: DEAD/DEAH box helicase family protein, partial [Pyrinomonadaceae bacterium]|nr:DEAD/DEAH box helicase family protein [Pyrinomonadaceae bacterium]